LSIPEDKVVDKGAAKPFALPCQGPPPLRPAAVGRWHMMSKTEVAISGTVVAETLLLNSKPFSALLHLGATHSFISTRSAVQLNLEIIKV